MRLFHALALPAGAALLLVARPLSVVASVVWFRFPWAQQVFLSWAGLRGAVPVVLATFPVMVGVPGGMQIFNLVFFVVVIGVRGAADVRVQQSDEQLAWASPLWINYTK